MNNIIKSMYRNIEDKEKIIAQSVKMENRLKVDTLKSKDVISFSNYLYEKIEYVIIVKKLEF